MSSSDYSAASVEVLGEIVRQAEARLQAQLTAAVAADQRAMTFAGLMLAAAAAMIGAVLGASPEATITAPIFVTALGLFASAIFAIIAARPVGWDFVGNSPRSWVSSVAEGQPLQAALADMADFYAEMIEENENAIARAAFWIRVSMLGALISLLIGLVAAAARML
jgi:CHASE3 domain sensor protein